MSLFKHAMVSGINDALVDNGVVSWPNEAVGFEVCSKIAADLDGPDMLPEGGLDAKSALLIGQSLKEASDALIAEGYGPDASAVLRTKQAAAMDFSDRAAWVAEACMSKAAAEASLTSVGPNTAESAVQTDQHAALDQHNRATNKYLMGVGRTAFPSGGVVGQQMVHPEKQKGPSISNSLTSLDKQAAYKRAFSVTPSGHALDAALARQNARDTMNAQNASDIYGDVHPIMGLVQGSNPIARGLRELSMRRDNYIAGKHEAGQNAYNPFGGLLTPSGMSRYGRPAEAPAEAPAAMEPKQAFSITDAGHALDAARARNKIESLQGQEQAYRNYDAANPHAARDSFEKEMAARALENKARSLSYDVRKHEAGRNAYNPFGGALTPSLLAESGFLTDKQANEDMSAADLSGAEEPGRMERAMMFLQGLKNKLPGFRPSPEAQVAAAGLGEAGTPGMEVMAHVLDTVKTAADAEDVLQQILHHQGEAGALASPELVEAIEHMMAQEGDESEQPKEAGVREGVRNVMYKVLPEAVNVADSLRYLHANKGNSVFSSRLGQDLAREQLRSNLGTLGKKVGITAGVAGTAYGAKKLYDHMKRKAGPSPEGGEEQAKTSGERFDKLKSQAEKGINAIKDTAAKYPRAATGAKVLAGTAALAGTAYGAKKLHDKYKSKKEMSSEEKKEAALLDYLKAAAEGSLTDVGENTEESAAHTDSVAELDMRNRAPGEYLTGVGNTRMPNKGQVYAVEPADQDSPVHTDNLPTNETKSAEFAYVNNFRKIASELGPYLPATMGRDEKVAHLQTLMGMPPSERSGYLKALRAG